ncbi:amidoligase family protein [Psychrosphaera aquimarina]|uniref:Amidoligase family protein n=1 Tax=Psychrosphaera aquimarina TaxID=2044854 RepID=A0ABU3QVM7_9GAMM|nr:amidoligase family protein [Psychrosphaera aquimarina]MDU0111484.1 amidoligase family protein [Psychrosphaera aquimarina]
MTQTFQSLPTKNTKAGKPRRVGFEVEFSNLSFNKTQSVMKQCLGGEFGQGSVAEQILNVPELGEFNIELDWNFLKRKASEDNNNDQTPEWLSQLAQASEWLVPMEIVCPPIEVASLDKLSTLIEQLREAGAQGTEESPIAAYGVHINTEITVLEPTLIHNYLRAFGLLQWWLVESNEVNFSRKLSPYIDLFSEEYLLEIMSKTTVDMDTLFDDYLAHNPTRNRALDMLPMLAEINQERVFSVVDDPKIKARPAFHYRLPNCLIDDPNWSLQQVWELWLVVETLANNEHGLNQLCEAFVSQKSSWFGGRRKAWTEYIDAWLKDQELA